MTPTEKIDKINQLAAKYGADTCIHCGDIGLFDHVSIKTMPAAELAKIMQTLQLIGH